MLVTASGGFTTNYYELPDLIQFSSQIYVELFCRHNTFFLNSVPPGGKLQESIASSPEFFNGGVRR
jgi:hypothetical protein